MKTVESVRVLSEKIPQMDDFDRGKVFNEFLPALSLGGVELGQHIKTFL